MKELKIGLDTTKCYVGFYSSEPLVIFSNLNIDENNTMSRKTGKTNTVATATHHNVRDSKGRFTSVSRATTVSRPKTNLPARDALGRFISASNPVVQTAAKPKSRRINVSSANPNDLLQGAKSSFLNSIEIRGEYIVVTMKERPRVEYGYANTLDRVAALTKARQNGRSMGSVYNTILKGNELFVTNWR